MESDTEKYKRCMREIKLRDGVIGTHILGTCSTGRRMTNIELICLQFRKIGELIMLSALCAHRVEYQKSRKNVRIEELEYDKEFRKSLERFHPDFYPIPFERTINNVGLQKNHPVTDNFLSKDDCVSMIGQCGEILHAFNPYNDDEVYANVERVEKLFLEWQRKIRRLLTCHEIKLYGADKRYFVHMDGPNHDVELVLAIPDK